MYQVTQSQTEQNIKLIACVKNHRCLYDNSDQNYKNSVYVDKAWQSVAQDFGENITDCKKKWRHLRSSLSRYLKSSKDILKNKNNKLKPYYLLQHMDFLVPYTKTLEMKIEPSVKFEKFEATDDGYEMKAETDQSAYEHEIIQEESQSMEEEEDIVYEAYEIQEQLPSSSSAQSQPQKSQITLVRSSHTATPQNTQIPQLQPLMNHSITPTSNKPQTLHLNPAHISHLAHQQLGGNQQQQQQHSPTGSISGNSMHQQGQNTGSSLQNTIIPIADDQSSADLNFFLALLPDVRNMNQDQKRRLRISILKIIDDILGNSQN